MKEISGQLSLPEQSSFILYAVWNDESAMDARDGEISRGDLIFCEYFVINEDWSSNSDCEFDESLILKDDHIECIIDKRMKKWSGKNDQQSKDELLK